MRNWQRSSLCVTAAEFRPSRLAICVALTKQRSSAAVRIRSREPVAGAAAVADDAARPCSKRAAYAKPPGRGVLE